MTHPEVLMVDPPWPQQKGGLREVRPQQTRDLEYPTLSVGASFQAIEFLLSHAHTVFLWEIDRHLIAAEQEMQRRGWHRHARLIWDKGNGVAPAFTVRFSHEYLVWWYRSPMKQIAPAMRGKLTTVIRAPGREHSRKPDAAYELVQQLYPDAVRMDVFSREQRDGWLQWGDQPERFLQSIFLIRP